MTTTDDVADSLEITKTDNTRQMGGTWVSGSIAGLSKLSVSARNLTDKLPSNF